MTIKGTFVLEHSHVKVVFCHKNDTKVQLELVPKMVVFRKFEV